MENHLVTSSADHKILINAIILIALGVSILFLNSWDSFLVKASVGLFWGAFFIAINWTRISTIARGQITNRQAKELSS
ncbi:MAG TPA: hypothetical protein VHQ64_07520 [Pyrinomonadaceae bacterium]|jgi:hypothetical protein|nr:hypothetical protein [Pyrinomonadaceae bacterium]